MVDLLEISEVAAVGLFTTSSAMVGAVFGLYFPIPKKVLASILAFASGSLISALAIELGYRDAVDMMKHDLGVRAAWAFIAGGFAVGATLYYVASLFLEENGAALRYPSRFLEFALARKRHAADEKLALLSRCDLLRHLPPDEITPLLDHTQLCEVPAGTIIFHAGDPGDALYIVADGLVEVLDTGMQKLAELGVGDAFGEMALLSGGTRTATIRAFSNCELLTITKQNFDRLLAENPFISEQIRKLSRERALSNLSKSDIDPRLWLQTARENMNQLSSGEEYTLMHETKDGKGAGLAIVFGNILDTIPGCLVIGANFSGFQSLPATLILGMFIGGIPEAAASANMLRKAGYSDRTIFGLWSSVLVAGIVAAVAGKLFISGSESMAADLAQAVAGGAILAVVIHAMIPEAIHKGGSGIVLPAVAGFLFSLYLVLIQGPL